MLTPQGYFVWNLAFLLVFGAILYVADRIFGVAVKRAIWNWTHDRTSRLPESEERGFIYRRRPRARMRVAVGFSVIETLVAIVIFRYNPFWEVINAAFDIPFLMIGFYLGPYLDKLFGHVDRGLDRLGVMEERIERGETTLRSEVGGAVRTASTRVRESVYPTSGTTRSSAQGSTTTATGGPAPVVRPAEPPARSAREVAEDDARGLDDFVGKK